MGDNALPRRTVTRTDMYGSEPITLEISMDNEWRKIKDEMPECDRWVVGYYSRYDGVCLGVFRHRDGDRASFHKDGYSCEYPTYWRYAPEMPKELKEKLDRKKEEDAIKQAKIKVHEDKIKEIRGY